MTPLRFAEVLSTAPAKLLPDYEGGRLIEGARADITVLSPERRWIVQKDALRSRSHNTPWLDQEVVGAVRMTVVGGEVVHESPDP